MGRPASGCLHREDPATLGAGSPERFLSPRECPPWVPWGSVSLGGTLLSPFLWSALEPPLAMPCFCQNRHQDQQDHASHAQADPVLQRVVLGGVGWKQKMEDAHVRWTGCSPAQTPGAPPCGLRACSRPARPWAQSLVNHLSGSRSLWVGGGFHWSLLGVRES